jgi:chaperonin GroES
MTNESGFQPTADKVLVQPIKVEEKTAGGIVLPKVSQEKEQLAARVGTLIAVGPLAEGAPELEGVAIGDVILYARYSGDGFPVDGVEYRIMRVSDVVGKVTRLPDYMLQGAKSSVEAFGFNKPDSVIAA